MRAASADGSDGVGERAIQAAGSCRPDATRALLGIRGHRKRNRKLCNQASAALASEVGLVDPCVRHSASVFHSYNRGTGASSSTPRIRFGALPPMASSQPVFTSKFFRRSRAQYGGASGRLSSRRSNGSIEGPMRECAGSPEVEEFHWINGRLSAQWRTARVLPRRARRARERLSRPRHWFWHGAFRRTFDPLSRSKRILRGARHRRVGYRMVYREHHGTFSKFPFHTSRCLQCRIQPIRQVRRSRV